MLYLEDLKLGDTFATGTQAVTAEEIIAFGRQFDPQSFHTDAVAARDRIKLHCRTLNQEGGVVQEMTARLLVPRRVP